MQAFNLKEMFKFCGFWINFWLPFFVNSFVLRKKDDIKAELEDNIKNNDKEIEEQAVSYNCQGVCLIFHFYLFYLYKCEWIC